MRRRRARGTWGSGVEEMLCDCGIVGCWKAREREGEGEDGAEGCKGRGFCEGWAEGKSEGGKTNPGLLIPPAHPYQDEDDEKPPSSPLIFCRPSYTPSYPHSLPDSFDMDGDDLGVEDVEWDEPVACADRVRALTNAFGRDGGGQELSSSPRSSSEPSPVFETSGPSSPMPGFHGSPSPGTSSSSPVLYPPSSSPAFPPSAPQIAFPPSHMNLDVGVPFAMADVPHADDAASSSPLSGPTSTPGLTTASSPLSPPIFTSPFLPTSTTARSPATPFHIRIPQVAWSDSLNGNRGGY
jgi:hypothetical protein